MLLTQLYRTPSNNDLFAISAGKLRAWRASSQSLESLRDTIARESRARRDDAGLLRHNARMQKELKDMIKEIDDTIHYGERMGRKS
jgi:hypothetical protein